MEEYTAITDEEIARRVQKGDREAFGILVDRYEAKIQRYGRKFLSGREDRDDIIQEVFIKAYANMKSFDASRRFSPWIYRIAHNEFVNAAKKNSAQKIFSFDLDILFPHLVAPETADSDVEKNELRSLLDQCLGRIGWKYRETLILYFFEEMDYREIADVLQIPVSTVGVRLKRGKEMLRKTVAALPNGEGEYAYGSGTRQ